jgi:hypothetical protein
MPATKSRPPKKRPVGRPPSGRPLREARIMVNLTHEQRARWLAAATADQRTLPDWLRIVADRASQ